MLEREERGRCEAPRWRFRCRQLSGHKSELPWHMNDESSSHAEGGERNKLTSACNRTTSSKAQQSGWEEHIREDICQTATHNHGTGRKRDSHKTAHSQTRLRAPRVLPQARKKWARHMARRLAATAMHWAAFHRAAAIRRDSGAAQPIGAQSRRCLHQPSAEAFRTAQVGRSEQRSFSGAVDGGVNQHRLDPCTHGAEM